MDKSEQLENLTKRARIIQQFGREAGAWREASEVQLQNLKVDLEEKAGNHLLRILNKIAFYCTYSVFLILLLGLIIYLAWLPAERVMSLFPNTPYLKGITTITTFIVCITFIFWGLSAENEKLSNKLFYPLKLWQSHVEQKDEAYSKLKAVKFFLRMKIDEESK